MAYQSEYKNKCDQCKDSGDNTFARIYYLRILGAWMHLCSKCWDKQEKTKG